MKKLFVAIVFAALVPSAQAQIVVNSKPISLYTQCINTAISRTNLEKIGQSIQFICYGDVAKSFFGYLASKATVEIKGKTGTFRARFMNNQQAAGQDFCWQQVETSDETPTGNEFGCQLYMLVGPFINE
jgi:hypothetical protein